MISKQVSKKLLLRLPVYLQYLKSLPESTENISATRIAQALELGDVLVRKDLAKVSSGGRRRLGYLRDSLIRDIEAVLDLNSNTCAIVIGLGKLGQGLLEYDGFENAGLEVLAGFDLIPQEGGNRSGKPLYPMDHLEDFCLRYNVRIGIITTPAEQAQQICDRMIACGIEAIWNFSSAELMVPPGILLQNENLVLSLTTLRLQLKNRNYPQDICS